MSNEAMDRPNPVDHQPIDRQSPDQHPPDQQPLLETMILTLPADRVQVYDGCVVVFDDAAEPMDFVNDVLTSIGAST